MKKVIVLVFVLSIISCQNNSKKEYEQLKKMQWLIGNWETETSSGKLTEIWAIENDSTYTATSVFMFNKDTLHSETITMYQNGENLIYESTTKGVNSNDPISFKLSSDNEKEYTFENPKNDFPKKITYKNAGNNSLSLVIAGKQQGKESKETFLLKK